MPGDGDRLDRIARNRDRLNACRRHRFPAAIEGIEQGVGAMFGGKSTCERCGGQLSLIELNQYVRGYEAGGGNGNEIIPGWRNDDEPKRRYFGQSPDER